MEHVISSTTPSPKRQLAFEVIANWLLPYLVYEATKRNWQLTDTQALLWATVVPAAIVVVELVRKRKFDLIASITLVTLIVSILIAFATADPRLLQLRESYLSAAIGFLMLGSVIIRRPALSWLAYRIMPQEQQVKLKHPSVQALLANLTWIWGAVSVCELAIKWQMIERMSIAEVLAWGPLAFGLLTLLGVLASYVAVRLAQRKSPERLTDTPC